MVVNTRPLKRVKRRVIADLFDFQSFPGNQGFADHYDGPFRSNIRSFLTKFAQLPPPSTLLSFPHLLTWQLVFRIGAGETAGHIDLPASSPATVTLSIVEEDVTRSRSVYCDQCRVVGWSGHPVCGTRYHFIIRADNNSSVDGYHHTCTRCGSLVHSSELRCKSCHYEISADDLEDWAYFQLEDPTHLLHGVIHSNGYGHLLRVNGREGGSKFLSGCDIMDFWDRLCKMLRVRKVSVMDVSKKYGLEYRLLHAVTQGRPWYGDWGYKFGSGSFALTLDSYEKAVDSLSGMPLAPFYSMSRTCRTRLLDIISFYSSLAGHRLSTVRDLFCYITRLLHELHSSTDFRLLDSVLKKMESGKEASAWNADDVDQVESAMLKVLSAVGESRWVTWRSLKGATCRTRSPGLLDHCLKQLTGKFVDGKVVRTRCNADTDAIEYRLEQAGDLPCVSDNLCMSSNRPSEDHLLRDLKFLFKSLLHPETMLDYKPKAMRELAASSAVKLLDCKQFIKDYESKTKHNPLTIRLLCEAELVSQPKSYTAPPPEVIVLPVTATIGDLKLEVTRAFQDVYLLFKRFRAECLVGYGDVDDSTQLMLLFGTSGSARLQGRCLGGNMLHQFRMERGMESWTVDCTCGSRDDDGERMLACDACGVWQHTRCAGIRDGDAVPARFVCVRCSNWDWRRAGRAAPAGSSVPANTRLELKPCPKLLTSCEDSGKLVDGKLTLYSDLVAGKFKQTAAVEIF